MEIFIYSPEPQPRSFCYSYYYVNIKIPGNDSFSVITNS